MRLFLTVLVFAAVPLAAQSHPTPVEGSFLVAGVLFDAGQLLDASDYFIEQPAGLVVP